MNTQRMGFIAIALLAILVVVSIVATNTSSINGPVAYQDADSHQQNISAGQSASAAPAAVTPLYGAFTWKSPSTVALAPKQDMNPTDRPLTGVEYVSEVTPPTTTPNDVARPFEVYYNKLLTDTGWKHEDKLEAGGPASALWVFSKGSDIVTLSYLSSFQNTPDNAPASCPCTMTFKIFSSSIERN